MSSVVMHALIIAAALLMTACSHLPTKPSPDSPSPLVQASCPEPVPMTGKTFGDYVRKVAEIGVQYRKCREAALASQSNTR